MARGKKDTAIATELGIAVATVRTYLTRLYRDNGFSNRAEAVAVWVSLSSGLSEAGQPSPDGPKGKRRSRAQPLSQW